MPDRDLLDHLRADRLDYPSLDAALRANAAPVIRSLSGAAQSHPESFSSEILTLLEPHLAAEPRRMFFLLHRVAAHDRSAMSLFLREIALFPKQAIHELWDLARENPGLLDPEIVEAICAHTPAEPPRAFRTLRVVAEKRPELIRREVVESVTSNLHAAAQHAFPFLLFVAKNRVDLAPLCTLDLFECIVSETNLYQKRMMIEEIALLAQQSHVQTNLERILREPVEAGGKIARTLMAILFRQRIRAKQRVLFEALKQATTGIRMWSFVGLLLESTDARQISSAAAEAFLEGAYRLALIAPDDWTFLHALRVPSAADHRFPEEVSFLNEDEAIRALYNRARILADNVGVELDIAPLREEREKIPAAEREREALTRLLAESPPDLLPRLRARYRSLEDRLRRWRAGESTPAERRRLASRVGDSLRAAIIRIALDLLQQSTASAYEEAARKALGRPCDLARVDPDILPTFLYLARLGEGNTRKYLLRLLEDRLGGRSHDWLWTEPAAAAWAESVRSRLPAIRLDRWRAPFERSYTHHGGDAVHERQKRIQSDLEQTRALLARLGIAGAEKAPLPELRATFENWGKNPPEGAPRDLVEEIRTNLARIQQAQESPLSDYEGDIQLSVETDPFRYLFMGEYGFASCLSMRGSFFWGAAANAVDVDKALLWARDPAGNIVGRRLIALTPEGVVSYRTYTNRHGLSLDDFFEDFIAAYADHCGTRVARGVKSGPLLSDRWYDDGAI